MSDRNERCVVRKRRNRRFPEWRRSARVIAWAALLGMLASSGPALAGDAEALHDPLRPPGWGETVSKAPGFNAAAWQLESTLTSIGRNVAIINGKPVGVGDRVGGARVLAVEAGTARLDYRGRHFTIQRPTTNVRARP